MSSNTYNQIRQAIIDKKQISCTYQNLYREICPHTIGKNKNGQEQTLGFQFAGESSKGLPPGGQWRCMPVDGISDVVVRDGPWHTGDNHSRPQTCVNTIDIEVNI